MENKKEKKMKTLKKKYLPNGEKRNEILDKAVRYLTDKSIIATQGTRMHFLLEEIGLTQNEYFECLHKACSIEGRL